MIVTFGQTLLPFLATQSIGHTTIDVISPGGHIENFFLTSNSNLAVLPNIAGETGRYPMTHLPIVRLCSPLTGGSHKRQGSPPSAGGNGGGDGHGRKKAPPVTFRMSAEYEGESASQLSIGRRLIEGHLPQMVSSYLDSAVSAPENIRILDIACGPGELTVAIAQKLAELRGTIIPQDVRFAIDGLDIDATILERARNRAGDSGINSHFYSADFRAPPSELFGIYDFIFSNEGLHWTEPPPSILGQPSIFYRHLPANLRKKFDAWAADRWRKTFHSLSDLLLPGGMALLQFGSEGQLDALYTLFDQLLSNQRFAAYKKSVWFPLYYPRPDLLPGLIEGSGLEMTSIEQWEEPLTEKTPEEVVRFVRGWTEPFFASVMQGDDLEAFYVLLHDTLNDDANALIHQIKWQRTVLKVKKTT